MHTHVERLIMAKTGMLEYAIEYTIEYMSQRAFENNR
jgi:hypothetical protein